MRTHLEEDSVIRAHKSISLSTGRPNSIFILSKLLFGGRPWFTLKLLYEGMGEEGNMGRQSSINILEVGILFRAGTEKI